MENRYAIVIGINDYVDKPLHFCVNDAKEIKNRLLKYASFKDSNIHMIVSDSSNPVKDITGQFNLALEEITKVFKKDEDFIFFYFAGHGFSNGSSYVMFQDSQVDINSIFEQITSINPKYQFYVFDSCYSGGKTLTRSKLEEDMPMLTYSKGTTLLYACTETQKAIELTETSHGIFTGAFLEVVDNVSLYNNGVLTPNRISDEVSRIVSTKTDWVQTPRTESMSTGYYPFAFFPKEDRSEDKSEEISQSTENQSTELFVESSVNITHDSIQDIRSKLYKLIESKIETEVSVVGPIFNDNYLQNAYSSFQDDRSLKNIDEILKHIVDKANKFTPLENCISYKKVRTRKPSLLGAFDLLSLAGNNDDSAYTITWEPRIRNDSGLLKDATLIFKSKSIENPSFGTGIIGFQAKWGLVVLWYLFEIDWDGQKDSEIREPLSTVYRFSLNEESEQLINESTFIDLELLKKTLERWKITRSNEIKAFLKE